MKSFKLKTQFTGKEISELSNGIFLSTNNLGSIVYTPLEWGCLDSKYNALLAANLNNNAPVDKTVMLIRYRIWIVSGETELELNNSHVKSFFINKAGSGTWNFAVELPGKKNVISLSVIIGIYQDSNTVFSKIFRNKAISKDSSENDLSSVSIIIRPDIDNRNLHENTSISSTVYSYWQKCISKDRNSFIFSPQSNRNLKIFSENASFNYEPEIIHNVYHKIEYERGMGVSGDLFSPGYFKISLLENKSTEITAFSFTENERNDFNFAEKNEPNEDILAPHDNSFEKVIQHSINNFIVKRDNLKTIIAGYPWFLDWGRDTLICTRGLITAKMFEETKQILLRFAKYEEKGTLPNNLEGEGIGSRDTSDAPLWFIIACKEYINASKNYDFLNALTDNNKTVFDTLKKIIVNYLNGTTTNNICVDKKSMLVYSPSHFTWMDTSNPAGTPREGYPIEIQALWYSSLKYLAEIDNNEDFIKYSEKVRNSIYRYYIIEETDSYGNKTGSKYLSDCLHCSTYSPASESIIDDSIRPNQIFAITLGLIDDQNLSKSILNICEKFLLIPGALRSLADKKNSYNAFIYGISGNLLNDPQNPYKGRYEGEEDSSRKAAYHNGTGWSWLFPSYPEAYYKCYEKSGLEHAIDILTVSNDLVNSGCIGHIPEIIDGDYPHNQRGCSAQAWSVTELYRVWILLNKEKERVSYE